jgi:hypothetical protein
MDRDTLVATLQHEGFDTSSFDQVAYAGDTPIYSLTVPFADRAAAWLHLRRLVVQTAHWPVIMTDIQAIIDGYILSRAGTPTQIFDRARECDPEAWLLDMGNISSYPDAQWVIDQVLDAIELEHDGLGDDFVAYAEMRAETETALTSDTLWIENTASLTVDEQLGFDYAATIPDEWKPIVLDIVFFPTTQWWEIPALISYYPADTGSDPARHVSLLRRWSTRYGVELVSLGRDSFTLRATRPPQDRAEALTLAWEHILYCEDIHILDVVPRAVDIYRGAAWGFWWD